MEETAVTWNGINIIELIGEKMSQIKRRTCEHILDGQYDLFEDTSKAEPPKETNEEALESQP